MADSTAASSNNQPPGEAVITVDMLRRLWPRGNSKIPGLIEGIVASAPRVFAKYGLNSDLVIAHAMAQFSHECGEGTEMVENVHYSAERACEVWPSRFSSEADCYRKVGSYAGDPKFFIKLIDNVYGSRMGNERNGLDDDDGYIYRGRGLAQTTGLEGYEKLQKLTGLPILANPDIVISPENALECGVADFVICGCLPYAQQDNVSMVTLRLNGGHIGEAEREEWLGKWKRALATAPATVPAPLPPTVATKHIATGSVVVATGGAVQQATQHGWPDWAIAAIVVIGILAAVSVFFFLHNKQD